MPSYHTTYAKPLRQASPALCGRAGYQLVGKGASTTAFAFLGASEFSDPAIMERVESLHPSVGVVLRDYGNDHHKITRALITLCRRQRRLALEARTRTDHGLKKPHHIARWQRPHRRNKGLKSMSVHTPAEAVRARRAKADIVFISPIFATPSHPGSAALPLFQARLLARMARSRAFGLGGITPQTRSIILQCGWFCGVAAITSLLKE